MPDERLYGTERRNAASENPQHGIALGKVIHLGSGTMGIHKADFTRFQSRKFQCGFHCQSRPYSLWRAGRLMVRFIGIAPARNLTVRTVRFSRKYQITCTFTKIETRAVFTERTADFRIQDAERIESVQRETAQGVHTADDGAVSHTMAYHSGSQHYGIAGGRTCCTDGRHQGRLIYNILVHKEFHHGGSHGTGRMHFKEFRISFFQILTMSRPEYFTQVHSTYGST